MMPDDGEARALMGAQPDPLPLGSAVRVVRRIAREFVALFVGIMDLGRRFGAVLLRTEYELAGACKQRGACCHHILLEWAPILDRFPFLGRIVLWKLTRFYSFFDRGYTWEIADGLMARVLGCHALRADGKCGEYRIRPLFCRTYPEIALIGKPMVLKGCGFDFKRRDGAPDSGSSELVQIRRRLEP